jgi:protein O-GlcNAc transferase
LEESGRRTSALNLLYEAISHHQKGNLAQAAKLYSRILRSKPDESNALKFLGILEFQCGHLAKAEELFAASIKSNPHSADCHYYLGRLCLLKSDSDRARHHFESTVGLESGRADALTCLGVLLHKRNNLPEALDYFHRAVIADPRAIEALLGKGKCLIDLGRHSEAVLVFDRVISIDPKLADGWLGRGNALRRLKFHDAAIAAYQEALSIDPRLVQAWIARGNVLMDLQRYDDALAAYDEALAIQPELADARIARGDVFFLLKQYHKAKVEYENALSIKNGSPLACVGLGNVLAALNRYDEALAAFDKALAINADCVEAWVGRGSTCCLRKDYQRALISYDKALTVRPDLPEALFGRCEALYGLRQYEESKEAYNKALAVELGHGDATNRSALLYNRGLMLERVDRLTEAIDSFRKAIAIDRDTNFALGHVVNARMRLCDWQGLNDDFDCLIASVQAGKCVAEPFTLLATPASAADQLRCSQTYVLNHACDVPDPCRRRGQCDHKRLRIAYVSADLRDHPVAFLMAGLFEQHDRSRFETFAISLRPDETSAMQERLKGAFDQFLDVSRTDDRDVATLLREKEIDIAVDLMGYTQHARPNIFALRSAPIQASYLGYPGTMGADFIDYVIADEIVLPLDQQPHYTEKIVHLPDCYLVNDSTRPISAQAPGRAQEGLPEKGFVFCCFNQSYKLLSPMFGVWMRLLAHLEGSVLWLSQVNDEAAANLRSEARARGIDPARLVFAARVPSQADYLARQTLADLFLDTLPYNAHSTASDALWAGLPVLTCKGTTFAGRAAASLLHAIGLPELATDNLEEYEALALRLAIEPSQLRAIRGKLEANRLSHPLFDTDRFRRHIEAAYRTMWDIWRRGETAHNFSVAPL